MTFQVNQLKNAGEFRNAFFPGLKLEERALTHENVDQLLMYDVRMLDALTRAESHYKSRHFYPGNGSGMCDPDPVSMMFRIRDYLIRFDSKLFTFSRSDRQTFAFVLENICEYFNKRAESLDQRDQSQLFRDYRFWVENFFTILDQKLSGDIIQVEPGEDGAVDSANEIEGSYLCFQNQAIRVPLHPFVLIHHGERLFLNRVTESALEYCDIINQRTSEFSSKNLDVPVFSFLLSSLDFDGARLIEPRLMMGDHEFSGRLSQLEKALNHGKENDCRASLDLLDEFGPEIMRYPMIILFKARCMLNLNQCGEMQRLLQKFVLFFPYYAETYALMGDALRLEKKYDRALGFYEKSMQISALPEVADRAKAIRDRLKVEKETRDQRSDEPFLKISEPDDTALGGLVGRERELSQMLEIMVSDGRSNVLIVGESGVGRSALISALDRELNSGNVPPRIEARGIREINFLHLISGSKYRGQFEEKALKLLTEFSRGNEILVLEEIHLMMSSGGSRGTSLDLVNILKPFLKDGSIRIVATTTYEEFKNTVEKDHTLMGHLQMLQVPELSREDTLEVLRRRAAGLMATDRITVAPGVLEIIVENAKRYFRSRKLPLGALILLNRCVAKLKIKNHREPEQRNNLIPDDVAEALADMLNLPRSHVSISMRRTLMNMERSLMERIVGQDDALRRLTATISAKKLNLTVNPKRPDGIFLFVGPTGVGKTETALALAEALYGSDDFMIRIDMSEYMERFTYSRFVGAAPGYVGYQDTNQLTDRVRRNPFSIVLLDEVEKADSQLLNVFLQVFDAGRMTDARGNVVDFSHTIFIMTSNIGTALFQTEDVGFHGTRNRVGVSRSAREKALRKFFTPEFLNRIDDIVYFRHLDEDSIRKIINLQLAPVRAELNRRGKTLMVDDAVLDFITMKGYSLEFGARNLSRTIQKVLLEPISGRALEDEWTRADEVNCTISEDEIRIDLSSPKQSELNEDRREERELAE